MERIQEESGGEAGQQQLVAEVVAAARELHQAMQGQGQDHGGRAEADEWEEADQYQADGDAQEQPQAEGATSEDDPGRLRPRVYLASLSDYNAGILHGTWLAADTSEDELADGIAGMLSGSPTAKASGQPAEEWALHDSEGFNGLHLDEYEGLGYLSRIGLGVAEHGVAFAHWAKLVAGDDELDDFAERYRGHWDTLEAYADELLDDLGVAQHLEAIPDWLQPYVELHTGRYARDLELGGDILTSEGEGGVHVWSSC